MTTQTIDGRTYVSLSHWGMFEHLRDNVIYHVPLKKPPHARRFEPMPIPSVPTKVDLKC